MKFLAVLVGLFAVSSGLALPLIGSAQQPESGSFCQAYRCSLLSSDKRRDNLSNHYGVFSTQKYGVPLFPIMEIATRRDYDGKIISVAVYVPVNREELGPYKAMLNGFSLETIGTRLDVMKLCTKQLPGFRLSREVSEAVSVLRGAPKTSTQSVNITCHYTTSNLVNPSFLLEFKINSLRMN